MKEIDFKSMKTLEYPKIINELGGFTVSPLGQEKIQKLLPSKNKAEVIRLLEETDDAVKMDRLKNGIPLGTFEDIRPHLKRMEIGALLSGQELIQIGQLIKGAREVYTFFVDLKEEEIELNQLYQIAERIIVLAQLERKIYQTLCEPQCVKRKVMCEKN